MDDIDLSEFGWAQKGGAPCAVRAALAALGEEDRRKLEAAMATRKGDKRRVTSRQVSAWLALSPRGIEVTNWTIDRHRRGDCSCRPE